jgi:hypothetical protein
LKEIVGLKRGASTAVFGADLGHQDGIVLAVFDVIGEIVDSVKYELERLDQANADF